MRDISATKGPSHGLQAHKKAAWQCLVRTCNAQPMLAVHMQYHAKEHAAVKPFRPVSGSKARLSMWSPNPYTTDPRPAPDIDFTIT
jgi:hypothetical protein